MPDQDGPIEFNPIYSNLVSRVSLSYLVAKYCTRSSRLCTFSLQKKLSQPKEKEIEHFLSKSGKEWEKHFAPEEHFHQFVIDFVRKCSF